MNARYFLNKLQKYIYDLEIKLLTLKSKGDGYLCEKSQQMMFKGIAPFGC